MGRSTLLVVLLIGALSGPGKAANDRSVIAGLAWDDPGSLVVAKLQEVCRDLHIRRAAQVRFPLARHTEQHAVCVGLRLAEEELASAVFVLADDRLKMIEAQGGALRTLLGERTDSSPYLSWLVFDDGQLIADPASDTVWLLSEEALHPHLFLWPTPFPYRSTDTPPSAASSAALPSFIAFGADLESSTPLFAAACPTMAIREIEDIWLPHEPETQTQIDCLGIDFAGGPRKLEAVFGDGVLELVWILTAKPEEERIRRALVDAHGPVSHASASWEVFEGGRIALRKDVPEVLAISERLVPYYAELLPR